MMKTKNPELERLTILLDRGQIAQLKHLAVDEAVSASEIVRRAVQLYVPSRSQSGQIPSIMIARGRRKKLIVVRPEALERWMKAREREGAGK